jgi:hypothetical protein
MSMETLLQLLTARERNKQPLVCYHSDSLPITPDEAIDAALRAGRPVLHVHFMRSDGNGRPCPRVNSGDSHAAFRGS